MAEFVFTDENFEVEALGSSLPVLVDCYADWCGPCKMMAPTIEELAGEYEGRVRIGKLDVDTAGGVAEKYCIQSIPTLLFIKDGAVIDRTVGVLSRDKIQDKLDGMLA